MAVSAAERKISVKSKRSQAVKQKLDLLKSRDGSEIPEIESLKDIDTFNRSMLFGSSGNENINYNNIGIEGLMRAYYNILQKLNGIERHNIITDTDVSATTDACLQFATNSIFSGTAYNSGFFVGNSSSNDSVKARANRGEFDEDGDALNDNGSTAENVDEVNILYLLSDAANLIGYKSVIGENRTTPGTNDSILGFRFRDIVPTTPVLGSDPTTYTYGDGTRDTETDDYYNSLLNTYLNNIKMACDVSIQYINYSKITDESYFTNPGVIPGRSNSFADHNSWIDYLTDLKADIDAYLTAISPYYTGGSSTSPAGRTIVDNALIALKPKLESYIPLVESNINTINGYQGTVQNPITLRGYRYLWVKAVIDAVDGSKTALAGIEVALDSVEKTIISSEEGFGLFGITKSLDPKLNVTAWIGGIPTPDVVGIETYATVDTDSNSVTFGEMIITGYIISWDGAMHSVGYDLFKSSDWDGNTGTWTHILPSGNMFSIEEIDLNNGRVLTYYIDEDTDPNAGEKPYYKVIAYDSGGTGDYARIPAVSDECAPKNYDDFLAEESTTPFVGPSGPAPSPPDEAPPYLFKWTTSRTGSQSDDNPLNTTFTSEAAFDSIGSNLEVFVDGRQVTQGTASDQYQISASDEIVFNTKIDNTSVVTMIVYFGAGYDEGGWKPPVETINNLPTVGNSHGDIRLVLSEDALYSWDSEFNNWTPIKSSSNLAITHTQLIDMPDEDGVNADHDARYYTRNELDEELEDINSKLDALESLLPEDALPLSGDVAVIDGSWKSGYLSEGDPNQFFTLAAHDWSTKIIRDVNFQFTPGHEDMMSDGDKGTLFAYLNGVLIDSYNLGAAFNESERNGPQSYTPDFGANNKIEITSVAPHNSFPEYQKARFKVYMSGSNLRSGENEIVVHHQLQSETRETKTIFFYDSETDGIRFDSIFVEESRLLSNKYLSGVRYYTLGDQLRFKFFMYNQFNNTYVLENQVKVDGNEFGIEKYSDNWKSNYVTSITDGSVDDYMSYSRNSDITIGNICKTTPVLKLIGKNPFAEYGEYISDYNDPYILVNTYVNYSNDKNEYFVDEQYRLNHTINTDVVPPAYKNQWNSNSLITSGQLQVFDNSLIYPNTNYTNNYVPEQIANYIGFQGARYYMRALVDVANPHNNGKLIIDGWNSTNSDVKVSIKLPGKTGWLDLSKSYNEADFTGSDGDGCLILKNDYEYSFTTGIYSTADSGYMILLRVKMETANTTPVRGIKVNW